MSSHIHGLKPGDTLSVKGMFTLLALAACVAFPWSEMKMKRNNNIRYAQSI
jgi:hypothetical protein